MIFAISTTSFRDYEEPPCEGAYKAEYTYIDVRTTDDPANLKYEPQDWYKKGSNHRVKNGFITRDIDDGRTAWFVDLEWSHLADLIDKLGRVVIQRWRPNPAFFEIEIYDTYRE